MDKVSWKPHFRAGINKSIEGSFTSQKAKQAVFTPLFAITRCSSILKGVKPLQHKLLEESRKFPEGGHIRN